MNCPEEDWAQFANDCYTAYSLACLRRRIEFPNGLPQSHGPPEFVLDIVLVDEQWRAVRAYIKDLVV